MLPVEPSVTKAMYLPDDVLIMSPVRLYVDDPKLNNGTTVVVDPTIVHL